ncbi:MAG TPA: glycosyltransferase [Thermoanaerobaculia bacterium]
MTAPDATIAPIARANPLRVLFVTNYAQARKTSGAAGIFAERQKQSLLELGVDVRSFDLGPSHSPFALFRSWRELRREIRRTQPDLLHAQYGTIVGAVSVLTGHPTVITFGGGDLQHGAVSWLRAFIGHSLSNFAILFAKANICVSERMRQAMWWRRKSAYVIPHGVDVNLFTPGSRDDARAVLGIKRDARVVALDGARDPRMKGLDIVRAAVEIARETLPNVELFVIRNVPPEQMPLVDRAADALICASKSEGSPNVVKEALACGTPVIAVPVGDVEERLRGVEPSAIVDRTPEAIAKAIVEVTRDPRRCNGREKVMALSLERTAERVIAVYEKALGRS